MSLKKSVEEIVNESENPLLEKHESWERKPLEELADIETGESFESDYFTKNEGIPLIRIRDIGSTETEDFYNNDYDERYLVRKGDILVGMDGDFDCAIWKGPEGLLNQRVARIRTIDDTYNDRLLEWILQPYLNEIHSRTSSTTVKHLSVKDLREISIPVPPPEEQERIVSKVERLFSQLENGLGMLKKSKNGIKNLRISILRATIKGKFTEDFREELADAYSEREDIEFKIPKNWCCQKLSKCYEVIPGKSFSSSDFVQSGCPVVKIANISHGKYKDETQEFLPTSFKEKNPEKIVRPNDLLLALTRPITQNKLKICRYPKNKPEALLNQRNALIKPKGENVDTYIQYILRSPYFKRKIQEDCDDTLQPNLSSVSLRNFNIPVPPEPEQEEIAEKLDHHFSILDTLEKRIESEIQRAERMKKSILGKTFRGELVPQKERESTESKNSNEKSNEIKTTTQSRLN